LEESGEHVCLDAMESRKESSRGGKEPFLIGAAIYAYPCSWSAETRQLQGTGS
jgi:hypothetical protein